MSKSPTSNSKRFNIKKTNEEGSTYYKDFYKNKMKNEQNK